jgi:L-iditol 2-dehydrogenase
MTTRGTKREGVAIKAAVLTGVKEIKTLDRMVDAPEPHQVQLEIKAVGICGSDLAYWSQGVAGGFVNIDFTEKGLCEGYCGQMGHECAGVVSVVGSAVTDLKVGDRVALEPGVPCAKCKFCLKGRYNLCKAVSFMGSAVNRTPGALCTLFNHDASFCYKLPDHVSLEEGAMFEPLCVALHSTTRAKVGMGMSVMITGAGPIGLMTALACKAAGATSISITDMVDAKLAKAKEIGVDFVYKANTADIVSLMENDNGGKFDVCFECCGVPSALDVCIKSAESGGTVCVVANMKGATVPCALQEAARREVDIVGVYRYCNLYPTALNLVASGKVNLKPLLSRTFSLEEANDAFEYFATGEPIKVIIAPSGK